MSCGLSLRPYRVCSQQAAAYYLQYDNVSPELTGGLVVSEGCRLLSGHATKHHDRTVL